MINQYTIKEASEIAEVSQRTIRYWMNYSAFSSEVIIEGKKKYVTDKFIERLLIVRKDIDAKSNVTSTSKTKKELLAEIEQLKKSTGVNIPETEEAIYDLISELIYRLRAIGNTDKIEVFSEDEYNQFQDALREYKHLEKNIKQQEVYFEEIKASKDEVIAHYKNQFEYQRQLADKQLTQMDTLLTYLKQRGEREGERAYIEAVEKKVITREGSRFNDPYNSGSR
jgi:DNA-binding transcriptional MerR regulator